jgi:CheY-like chemotaxis protein
LNLALSGASGDETMCILVVDDDILNRTILVRLLGNLGYQAEAAESGEMALQLLAQKQYNLVLMDCQMPECDGYTTTVLIRSPESIALNPAIPIIALTADSSEGTYERCLDSGMDAYLIKPVNQELLRTTINKYLAG